MKLPTFVKTDRPVPWGLSPSEMPTLPVECVSGFWFRISYEVVVKMLAGPAVA